MYLCTLGEFNLMQDQLEQALQSHYYLAEMAPPSNMQLKFFNCILKLRQ